MPYVLIIDDEPVIRDSLAAYLEDFNFRVLTSNDAETALVMLEKEAADAIVVDVHLPGINGMEFIHSVYNKYEKTVFFIYTGSPDFDLYRNIAELPRVFPRILAKPICDLSALVTSLHRMLDSRTGQE